MEKQKRWQFYLILAVILLTLYNIMPTVFYYTKPLGEPINEKQAYTISESLIRRVNDLENESKEWLSSFCKLIGVKPLKIELREQDPRLIDLTFNSSQSADLFKRFLPRAGELISFVPAKLQLDGSSSDNSNNKVTVIRQVGVHLDAKTNEKLFEFTNKYDAQGAITPFYRELVYDRLNHLALALAGTSQTAALITSSVQNPLDKRYDDTLIKLARDLNSLTNNFQITDPLVKRYLANFIQSDFKEGIATGNETLIQKFVARLEKLKTTLNSQIEPLKIEQKKLKENNQFLDTEQTQSLALLENQQEAINKATILIRDHTAAFKSLKPFTRLSVQALLEKSQMMIKDNLQKIELQGRNPFVEALVVDWNNDKISLQFYQDIEAIRLGDSNNESKALIKDTLNQMIINDIARASRLTDENLIPDENSFSIHLNNLSQATSFLAFNLGELAEIQGKQIIQQLQTEWIPQHPDLVRDAYPIFSYQAFKELKAENQKLGLVVYIPSNDSMSVPEGFRPGSLYIIAKGMEPILQKFKQTPDAPESQTFIQDINRLTALLQQFGFIGYPGTAYETAPQFAKDYIFEMSDFYGNLIKATRENFNIKGSKKYAVLDFTDVEQRILVENKIQDEMQESLLRWKEEYHAAQVDLNITSRYQVPAPTRNVYWENLKLSFIKYFRGDDRKILKWGLDLSGGKTVRIGLRDHNGRAVTNPDDLKQAVNELYTRINKMGVSERTIKIEGNNIILDFPGSQNLSASDLIKASAMYFHVVNEKFSRSNPILQEATSQFLQNVWNEAVVTNRKDSDSINEIAWQQLGGEEQEGFSRPLTDYAKILYDNGLRLPNPKNKEMNHSFDDTLSAIGIMRGENFSEWDNQANPLLIIFHNYALEGASLTGVQVGYDTSEGNVLTFNVKRSYEGSQEREGNPRDDFYSWTSQFSQDKIVGTPKENYSQGRGWRMAVILNGTIISSPSLKAALRDGATISGRFSQREVNQLAADLKAGSLSFTPRILSEQNVSPELGQEERTRGIVASLVALIAVVAAMIGYYRFAGVVAACAVLFNILIIWGVLQNLDAAITLPGIAGIVLTIGMAVDANVLVFERVREEFKLSGRLASAIQAGYRKAFSAIIDSNITTIMAALILIQFDSGPIKGFAITLIIGIISSMFTALFMTRYFFAGWVQDPNHKSLTMSQFIGKTAFDFLAQTKKAMIISAIVIGIGMALFAMQFKTMLGMDFTGGYSLIVDLVEKPDHSNYRLETAEALLAQGATNNDFQIRELGYPNQLRIQLGMGMEQKGHPFYQLPENIVQEKQVLSYESNPRLTWVVNALKDKGLEIKKTQLDQLDRDWTAMSGQFSDTMRFNAIMGLVIALVSILIYITFRFEFKFAIGAVIGLIHDVVISLGILAFFHWLGLAVQIDLQVVGAIMTIIGYSLNDTIIVFDRIREDMVVMRKMKFTEIVNHALNVTLSRTIMTCGTTLLVLLALVLLGGKSIFAFSLVMTIGVVVGTLSSLFIAGPVLVYFHNRELEAQGLAGSQREKLNSKKFLN